MTNFEMTNAIVLLKTERINAEVAEDANERH
jgi:hypothetical protein